MDLWYLVKSIGIINNNLITYLQFLIVFLSYVCFAWQDYKSQRKIGNWGAIIFTIVRFLLNFPQIWCAGDCTDG